MNSNFDLENNIGQFGEHFYGVNCILNRFHCFRKHLEAINAILNINNVKWKIFSACFTAVLCCVHDENKSTG